MVRRIVPLAVVLSLLCALVPAPALAVSTQTEIEMGREEDQQIVESSVIETDPLLNAYVQKVAGKLWRQVARKDVPYNVKIIKDSSINAFSTMGGYVYVDEGMIDFVQSDDELAGVIGHETGHIERRHVITEQSKAEALNLLFGIASIFSPIIYQFGNLMEAGVFAKVQRENELQADRYGLQLMSRAGYDPDAMKTMMEHLGVLQDAHASIVDKYLQSHPDPKARVAHLVGYPELNPKDVTNQQRLVQAASDEERCRYEFSMLKLQKLLANDPSNAELDSEARLDLGEDEIALGYPNKGQQTLAEVAQDGSPQAKALADQRIMALRAMETDRVDLQQPDLERLRSLLAQADTTQAQANTQIAARRDEARDQLKGINDRVNALQYEVPDFGRVNVRHGSRLEAIEKNLMEMSRSINSAIDDDSTTIDNVGSLAQNKESGLLLQSHEILDEMNAPLKNPPIPPASLAILPSYPRMIRGLETADGDMIRSVDAARASMAILDGSLGDLDEFFRELNRAPLSFNGDLSESDFNQLEPMMQKALVKLNDAATAASQSNQLYNMARVRQLSARITMLGVGTSPQRYATLRKALAQKFGPDYDGVSYGTMLRDGITPGDVVVADILAADIKSSPQDIVDQMQRTHTSPVDIADKDGMHAWPLEIFTGLIYLDYTDDPVKEMQPGGGGGSM
jgi:predicted Zn-dependent protease